MPNSNHIFKKLQKELDKEKNERVYKKIKKLIKSYISQEQILRDNKEKTLEELLNFLKTKKDILVFRNQDEDYIFIQHPPIESIPEELIDIYYKENLETFVKKLKYHIRTTYKHSMVYETEINNFAVFDQLELITALNNNPYKPNVIYPLYFSINLRICPSTQETFLQVLITPELEQLIL